MLTSYAKCYLCALLAMLAIACTAPALGVAFDLLALGFGYWVFLLPSACFLVGGLLAMKAEKLEPDPLPPCLVRWPTV